ncbi:phospholipid-binding protein MlaC [Thalassotalea aquiviva]|uniref:MlaC/ttg2D family ABC transporter substrate-binding protein n=1 Tax=Thalassotalea aquiviva TaxID=3242415 RepID=UPI003529DFFA
MRRITKPLWQFWVFTCLILGFSHHATAEQINAKNPYQLIQQVGDITFKRFANEEAEIKKNPELLKDIVREELMPYVFYQYAGLKVLGNYRKSASKEELKDFLVAFREYLITSYAQVFTLYDNQEVVFNPIKEIDKESIVMVPVDILMGEGNIINLVFKVRLNNKTNEWQAYDLVAEGISMLDSKTKELRSILAQNGVPRVTEMLLEKSKRKIEFKDGENLNTKIQEQAGS